MKLAIDIVQILLLPKLEKDASFCATQTNIAFWKTFTTNFLDFEKDAKPVYAAIYSLELKDAEKIISKLDTVYISFIKELAENHVLGISSKAIDYLITSKNSAFKKKVHYFTNLQNAIKKVERKRIKTELPKTFEKLIFQLSDDDLSLTIKKKEREALKEKMNAWDKKLIDKNNHSDIIKFSLGESKIKYSLDKEEYTYPTKKEHKIISLSWIKYAAAACVVLTTGIMYFKLNTDNNLVQPGDTNVVTAPVKKETITPEIPSEALAEVASVTKNAAVIESGLGFASKKNNIKIVENNQKARMVSIVSAIEKYRQLLENEFSENKVGDSSRIKELETKINSLQKELALLKERENQYVFDGKALVLYVSKTAKENTIVFYNKKYYLKKDSDYYLINSSKINENLIKETNTDLIEILNVLFVENK